MKEPLVSVIIVNWNGKKFLGMCLDSVFKQSYKNFNVILVDNCSSDDSVRYVKKRFPKVKIIQLDKNYGFSIANNIGFEKAFKSGARYVAILNNDTKVDKNWLVEMVNVAESDEKIGSCACKILCMDEPNKIDTAGMQLYENCMPGGRGCHEPSNSYPKIEEVFGAPGAAALYRREMLEDIKLNQDYFDSDFFAFQEEFDLSWRALLRGWKCVYVSSSIVYHKGSTTWKKTPNRMKYLLERNRIWALVKNIHKDLFYYCLPHIILYELLSLPFYFFRFQIHVILRARMDALRGIKRFKGKRKKIQRRSKVSASDVKKWFVKRNYMDYL